MNNNNINNSRKVVPLAGRGGKKQGNKRLISRLQDVRAAIYAIKSKICLLCGSRKLCVNKTGLCAGCYATLNPQEKKIADNEAAHKIISIIVSDDRLTQDNENK